MRLYVESRDLITCHVITCPTTKINSTVATSMPLTISAILLSSRNKAVIVNAMLCDIQNLLSKMSGLCKEIESLQPLHLITIYIQLGLCSFILLACIKSLIGN